MLKCMKSLLSTSCIQKMSTSMCKTFTMHSYSASSAIFGEFFGYLDHNSFLWVDRWFYMYFCIGLHFMSLFHFKLWCMTKRMGSYQRGVQFETHFFLVEGSEGSPLSTGVGDGIGESKICIVFFPLLEGSFRAVLQGNENNELEICLERGKNCMDYKWYKIKFLL